VADVDTSDDPKPERTWRTHPLPKRLALIAIVALGLWLWKATEVKPRRVFFQLEGTGWSSVRAIDVQVSDPDGDEQHVRKRVEQFFPQGPPAEVLFILEDLPEGTYPTQLFVKVEGREPRVRLDERLTVGESDAIVHKLRLPATSR
jgi:hypothetical protein